MQLSFISARAGVSPATFSALTWTLGFVRTDVRSCIHIYRIPSKLFWTHKGRDMQPIVYACFGWHLMIVSSGKKPEMGLRTTDCPVDTTVSSLCFYSGAASPPPGPRPGWLSLGTSSRKYLHLCSFPTWRSGSGHRCTCPGC